MHAAKDRLVQTFKFLKELNELRNPVPRDLSQCPQLFWLDEWPVHPFVTMRRGDRSEEGEEGGEEGIEPLIRVRRAILMCQNHDCGVKNTWRGVSDRL